MRVFDRFLVAVYVALAALPVIAMTAGIRGRELYGVLPPTPRPALEVKSFIAERFQHELVAWFESNLGLKGNSIALDNAVLYHAFGETRYGAFVRLGKDGVIFPHEDINFFNKHGYWVTDPAHVDKIADEIATAQRSLRTQGRAFVPVFIPSKTTVWRDKIPERWIMDLPAPRPADQTMRLVREALDRRGVLYVDTTEVFARSMMPRAYLFGPDARHWSEYGACLALNAVASRYTELTGKPRPALNCTFAFSSPKRRRVPEFDLWQLLNAQWTYRTIKRMPRALHDAPTTADAASRPRTLFIGTSFCWTLMFNAEDSGAFGPLTYNYYNQTFIGEDGTRTELKAGSEAWQQLTMENDLFVLDLFESYLAVPGSYVDLFLTDLVPALEPRR